MSVPRMMTDSETYPPIPLIHWISENSLMMAVAGIDTEICLEEITFAEIKNEQLSKME